ncbi:hypothetical protein [Vibrio rotiferianus]|uniref:hypothetical protein n=1 Tax=Vibrio rotiferianus TaxID=190895 RepID=UPI00406A64B3
MSKGSLQVEESVEETVPSKYLQAMSSPVAQAVRYGDTVVAYGLMYQSALKQRCREVVIQAPTMPSVKRIACENTSSAKNSWHLVPLINHSLPVGVL